MKFLKKLVEEKNESIVPPIEAETSMISIMRKNLGGYRTPRGYSTIHASEITKDDFCPRRVALVDTLDLKLSGEFLPAALKATFDVGEATAKLVVEEWLGDKAIGNWVCLACGTRVHLSKKPGYKYCDSHPSKVCRWSYEEVSFKSAVNGVTGSLDVLVDLGGSHLFVAELKIMAPDAFEKLVAPLMEHRVRTNLYMKIVSDSLSPFRCKINQLEARVLYVSRGHGKKNLEQKGEILPFKEFVVTRDESVLVPLMKKADAVHRFRTKGVMPKGICSTSFEKTAKGCVACSACFSGKFPVGV